MKNKIIAIIICISVITSVLCLSSYAYVSSVNVGSKYTFDLEYINDNKYVANNPTQSNRSDYDITGNLIINGSTQKSIKQIQIIRYNPLVSELTDNLWRINLIDTDNTYYSILSNRQVVTEDNYVFTVDTYSVTAGNQYNILYILNLVPPDMYDNTENLLTYIINCFTSIINYCITNTVILVVISIAFVSLAVGILIRINRKKF